MPIELFLEGVRVWGFDIRCLLGVVERPRDRIHLHPDRFASATPSLREHAGDGSECPDLRSDE